MSLLDHDEFERWRRQSSAAVDAATSTAAAGSWSWCCFLSEQAAQLAVTGLLRAIGEPEQAWGHDLVTLVDRAGRTLGDPLSAASIADAAARLARHYISTRYPDAHAAGSPEEHYRQADAQSASDDVSTILAAVDRAWNTLLASDGEPPVEGAPAP